jgi:hypothetical protein
MGYTTSKAAMVDSPEMSSLGVERSQINFGLKKDLGGGQGLEVFLG